PYLELADGPLFGHELSRSAHLPRSIVLSACELGLTETGAGDDPLGMTTALLHGGAGSVIAGVARISDHVARTLGEALHQGLRRGLTPAAALAEAISVSEAEQGRPAPVACFGAG